MSGFLFGIGNLSNYPTGLTSGSVVFIGSTGLFAQDNSNLFWDNTNKRLGIGTKLPSQQLTLGGTVGNFGMSTSIGSDNALLQISGGGNAGSDRGAYLNLYGNQSGVGGKFQVFSGNGSYIEFYTTPGGLGVLQVSIGPNGLSSFYGNISIFNPAPSLHLTTSTPGNSGSDIQFIASNSQINWKVSQNQYVSGAFEITPSTVVGGSTFTTPAILISSNGNVGIGTTSPAVSALLDLTSTTGALLVPRMTTTQRDALTAVDGMIIYNTTTAAFNKRQAAAWVAF